MQRFSFYLKKKKWGKPVRVLILNAASFKNMSAAVMEKTPDGTGDFISRWETVEPELNWDGVGRRGTQDVVRNLGWFGYSEFFVLLMQTHVWIHCETMKFYTKLTHFKVRILQFVIKIHVVLELKTSPLVNLWET